jgi:hypothetical protein
MWGRFKLRVQEAGSVARPPSTSIVKGAPPLPWVVRQRNRTEGGPNTRPRARALLLRRRPWAASPHSVTEGKWAEPDEKAVAAILAQVAEMVSQRDREIRVMRERGVKMITENFSTAALHQRIADKMKRNIPSEGLNLPV